MMIRGISNIPDFVILGVVVEVPLYKQLEEGDGMIDVGDAEYDDGDAVIVVVLIVVVVVIVDVVVILVVVMVDEGVAG